jgi:energy-coupling factor transporter transmembrane protein EcfT
MKIIKSILDRPYLVLLIAALIALIFPTSYFVYSMVIIFVIFATSAIYTIVQKKWLRLILSVFGFLGFFMVWLGIIFFKGFSDELKPQIQIGDSKFYSNEIANSTNLNISNKFKLLSKLDTIVYMGLENEYDAECLYTGSTSSILELEKNISSQKEFSKIEELENYPTKVITMNNFNLKDIKSVYKKESEGSFKIYIAFDKNNSKFYYSAFYY